MEVCRVTLAGRAGKKLWEKGRLLCLRNLGTLECHFSAQRANVRVHVCILTSICEKQEFSYE